MTTHNKRKTSTLIILVIALLLMALFMTVVFFGFGANKQQTAFFARSINDASYDCEDKIDSKFDEDLVSKYYDEISSRYEAKRRQYVIYYRVSAYTEQDGVRVVEDYMAKCIVWERVGYVSDFQILRNI